MPVFTIFTNVPKEKIPADFAKIISAELSKAMGKPEQFIAVHVNAGQSHLIFGGSDDPCGYGSLLSIGALGPALNKKYSALLAKLVKEKLGISPDRWYIHFVDAKPSEIGWNGGTFEGIL